MSWEGGCQCGKVRYRLANEPIVVYTCHCHACQKQSSSGFGISVWVAEADFSLVRGKLGSWGTEADSGKAKICTFCVDCGSRIYHCGIGDANILSIKGGTLDRMAEFEPVAHIWIRSAQPWVRALLEGQLQFETQPDSFAEMIRLYRCRLSGSDQK
ncbi:MAG: GFA family protein [Gammaproteobacteria bacterium]|nr:GFA family protein [Gammaproteobacteria bacterium]MYD76481.1 GFA family protein [Gammaproteobacteria bacterium]MYJ51906.1 GFA family protein [Gammaproteobacteria bacterium]